LLVAPAAWGASAPKHSVLLFPFKSHWLSEPLAQAVTAAVASQLSSAGYAVTEARMDSPVVQLAVQEEWVPGELAAAGNLEEAWQPLAIAVAAEAALLGEVIEGDRDVVLRARVAGTISRSETKLEVMAPRLVDREAVAGEIAARLLEALTPELWAELGAEGDGKEAGALARYAAGRTELASGLYREAVLDFEGALLGEPRNPDFLRGSADARAALGDYSGAAVRMRSLAAVIPSDAEIALQLGYAALRAGEATEAEAAFKEAAEQLGSDPRVVEGLALSMRAQNQPARAQEYYDVLVTLLPGLMGTPPWLSGLLANAKTSVTFSDLSPDEISRELGRLYLAEGKIPEGVQSLLAYYETGGRPPYQDDDYMAVAAALDTEAEAIARAAQGVFAAQAIGQFTTERAHKEMDALHSRSDALATLAEKMQVSPRLDPAHRYRVLAYNLLNESNFEALMFVSTSDAERQRRAELLRDAFRKSVAQAGSLATGLLGAEPARLLEGSGGQTSLAGGPTE